MGDRARQIQLRGDRTLRDCAYHSPGSYCKLLGINFKGNVTRNNTFVNNFPNKQAAILGKVEIVKDFI